MPPAADVLLASSARRVCSREGHAWWGAAHRASWAVAVTPTPTPASGNKWICQPLSESGVRDDVYTISNAAARRALLAVELTGAAARAGRAVVDRVRGEYEKRWPRFFFVLLWNRRGPLSVPRRPLCYPLDSRLGGASGCAALDGAGTAAGTCARTAAERHGHQVTLMCGRLTTDFQEANVKMKLLNF